MSFCKECGKPTSRPETYRCRECFLKTLPWKYTCSKCGKRCSKGFYLCWECYLEQRKISYFCIDCGKEISKKINKRCQTCFGKLKSKTQIGKNNPNWNPNREQVFAPYTEKHFMENIRKQILEEQDFACGYCRGTEGGKFDLHHIDYDKQNDERWNKIFLCDKCHGKTNGTTENRQYWQEKLENLNILYIRGGIL